ncbi:NADH-quinone oxidoreductase subunit J [Aurantimonas sp. C2-6-R+9]|uniref:NADH-quinone oxidoreductase subunit J n=1 Tax=unclassified Aurantimonas TaxID=2638230 RepID=UPI002E175B0A|nr:MULTISPECIES: NADH-quinone oxidoreductase subunit J [unclassified Aurantimonas]MEC5289884.1 NADH-quinone oxidoreductase subunit J [Aurantimonas sp. C2-3-R2]MEC5379975.1 NADH-quinone oxidoreductase subunit J [Aurantimonas sp. C2-6-R+9]MEC5410966.1 NADH-quinone oxidoreductase subunit J [Aurantimonas sp. C2-4-R8]
MLGLQALFFYIFALIAVGAALMVVFSKNPVHSVLFLITTFVSAAGLFLLTGAEFLALILVVVYVGAVAVLFLFVVMMLDVDFAKLKRGALQYAPFGAIVGIVLLAELIIAVTGNYYEPQLSVATAMPTPPLTEMSNIEALGAVLYTRYILFFQLAGLILFVAMIGAIVLTLRHKEGIRRQSIPAQVARNPATAIEIRKVESGKGI